MAQDGGRTILGRVLVEGAAQELALVAAQGAVVVADPAGVALPVGEEALLGAFLAGEEDDLAEVDRRVLEEDRLLEGAIVGVDVGIILVALLDAPLQGVDVGCDLLGVRVVLGILGGIGLQAVAQRVEVDGLGEGGDAGALGALGQGLAALAGAGALAGPLGDEEVLALGLGAVLLPNDLAFAVGEGHAHAVEPAAEALAAVPQHHAVDGIGLAEVKLPGGGVDVLLGVGDGVGAEAVGGVAVDRALGGGFVGGAALGGLAGGGDVLVAHEDLHLGQRERRRLARDVDRHITGPDRAVTVRGHRRQQGGQSESGALHGFSPLFLRLVIG